MTKWPWLSVGLAAAACSGTSGKDGGLDAGTDAGVDAGCQMNAPTSGDLPGEVRSVLQLKCVPCHQNPPINHAPFPLETYEDTQIPFGLSHERLWVRVSQVIEPPTLPHMPPEDAGQLDAGDFATLRAWFAACAPGLPEDGGDPGEDGGP